MSNPEQTPTKVFLPNEYADEGDYRDGFKLTPAEWDLLRPLTKSSRKRLLKRMVQPRRDCGFSRGVLAASRLPPPASRLRSGQRIRCAERWCGSRTCNPARGRAEAPEATALIHSRKEDSDMQPSLVKRLALASGLMLCGAGAQAALISYQANGVDLVYDDGQDLTWLRDANLFKSQYDANNTVVADIIAAVPTITSGNGAHNVVVGDFNTSNGRMSWYGAMAWAEWLGSMDYAGADDWRLPTTVQPDATCDDQFDPGAGFPLQGRGYNCTGSDLGDLFYTVGGLSANDGINDSAILTGAFTNMQDFVYWSGAEYAPDPYDAWAFVTGDGSQGNDYTVAQRYGWAVRPGQIAAAPLPGTALLMALGFGAMTISRRARRRFW